MDEVIQFEPLNNSIIYRGISICHYQSAKQKTNTNYAHQGHWCSVWFYPVISLTWLHSQGRKVVYNCLIIGMNMLHVGKCSCLEQGAQRNYSEYSYLYLQVWMQLATQLLNLHKKLVNISIICQKSAVYVKQFPATWLCILDIISVQVEISLPALQIGTLPVLEI